jgi:hypothetical protein
LTSADPRELIPQLDRKGLRDFGLVTGAMFAGLFGLLFPWLLGFSYPVWPWVVLGILGGTGLLFPLVLRPVHYWWMRIALMISKVTTPIILGTVFFVLFAPLGLLMRLFGWDPMRRNGDERAASYRVTREQTSTGKLENPF